MSNTNDKKFSDLLKAVKERATEINSLIGILTAGYILLKEQPGPFVYAIAVVSGSALWLSLFYVWRRKDQSIIIPGHSHPHYSKRKRIAALAGLVLLPVLAGGLATYAIRRAYRIIKVEAQDAHRPVLDCPPLAVTVAGFKPASEFEADRAPAQRVRHNFLIELQNRIERLGNQSIKTNELDGEVVNQKVSEWENAARQLGQSEKGQAHLVVYGALRKAAPIKAEVYVCRVNRCANQADQTAITPPVQAVNPPTWQIGFQGQDEDEVSKKMADTAMFVIGAALYEQHDLERAKDFLIQSNIPEARFYQGLIYWELARQHDPLKNLNLAAEKFQEIISNSGVGLLSQEFIAHANANAGSVSFLLSQADYQQAERYIGEAEGFYDTALTYYEQTFDDESAVSEDKKRLRGAWAATKGNLALAKIAWAKMQGPQLRQSLFTQAEGDLRQALQHYERSKYPSEWVATTSNLASLWLEQSAMAQDPKEKLTQAKEAFEAVLEAIDQNDSLRSRIEMQYQQAQIRGNLAAVYSNEAFETMMRLDKAEELYRQAGALFTREKYALAWAKNTSYLGLVLTKLARLPENQQRAVNLLEAAITGFKPALEVFEHYPRQWALTTAYCADAYREMSKQRDHADAKREDLSQAVKLAKQALETLQSAPANGSKIDLARVQQILGNACYDLSRLSGSDKMSLLNEAWDAYTFAQNTLNEYGYHYEQGKAEEGLKNVQTARQN